MNIILTDFGNVEERPHCSYLKRLSGSPLFMSPEKFQRRTTDAADIWALGTVLFESYFLAVPYQLSVEDNIMDKKIKLRNSFRNIVSKEPGPHFPDYTLSIPGRAFISSCLKKQPVDRPTALELIGNPWIDNEITRPPHVLKALKCLHNTPRIAKLFLYQLSTTEQKSIEKQFTSIKFDENQRVDFEEYKSFFGEHVDEKDIVKQFNALDVHNVKTISHEQLMAECAFHYVTSQDDRLIKVLKKLENMNIDENYKPEPIDNLRSSLRAKSLTREYNKVVEDNGGDFRKFIENIKDSNSTSVESPW